MMFYQKSSDELNEHLIERQIIRIYVKKKLAFTFNAQFIVDN